MSISFRHYYPSGSEWLGPHRTGTGSVSGQAIWILWWAKWPWYMFLSQYFGLPCPSASISNINPTFCALGTNSNLRGERPAVKGVWSPLCRRASDTCNTYSFINLTCYGLDGPGSNTGGGEIYRTCPDRLWGPHSPIYNGYRVIPGGKAAAA